MMTDSLSPEPNQIKENRMFSFACPVNPLGGKCPYGCKYCWATGEKGLVKRYGMKKYLGNSFFVKNFRLPPIKNLGSGNKRCYWLCDMLDLLAPNISDKLVEKVFGIIQRNPMFDFLTLTKNPARYHDFIGDLQKLHNVTLGATIETNKSFFNTPSQYKGYDQISKAPSPRERLYQMYALRKNFEFANSFPSLFICIEPILDFEGGFMHDILDTKPKMVAIGMDNYNWHLPEPPRYKVYELIKKLEENGIEVIKKTIRKAWYE